MPSVSIVTMSDVLIGPHARARTHRILLLRTRSLLTLRPILPPLDVLQHLPLSTLTRVPDDLFVSELPDDPLENVYRLLLEVVLMIVHPSEQSRYERGKMGRDCIRWEGDDCDLDKAQSGLYDLAILRAHEDGDRGDELGYHRIRDVSCTHINGYRQEENQHEPLNSKLRRESALMLALIMCGVVPVNPAATIVMYSSTSASTDSTTNQISKRNKRKIAHPLQSSPHLPLRQAA